MKCAETQNYVINRIGTHRLNTAALKTLVNGVEKIYEECWRTLADLRNGAPGSAIRQFQNDLGRAMQSVEDAYQVIARNRQDLIRRKPAVSNTWFAREQSRLDSHQQMLCRLLGVGYSLGDAFAWFFYQFDRELLGQHAAHERQKHPAIGFGGQAELASLAALIRAGGYVPVYHGITTILRLGDISLVDMKRWRVVAIGEVKTTVPDATGRALATVNFMGHSEDFKGFEFAHGASDAIDIESNGATSNAIRDAVATHNDLPDLQLSASRKARLERQIERTQRSMRRAKEERNAPGSGLETQGAAWRGLEAAALNCRKGQCRIERLDGGLVVVIHRTKRRSLFARLRSLEVLDPGDFVEQSMAALQSTVVANTPWNAVVFGEVHYDNEGMPVLPNGTLPVLWWKIEPKIAKQIVFHGLSVVTIWNPAKLLERLSKFGFEVDSSRLPHRVRLTKATADGRRISYVDEDFSRLSRNVLASEEDLAQTIIHFWSQATNDVIAGKRIRLRTVQEFFSREEVQAIVERRESNQ